jgi:hypothetical protein
MRAAWTVRVPSPGPSCTPAGRGRLLCLGIIRELVGMIKYSEFDKRDTFGSIDGGVPASSRVARTLEDRIAEGDQVTPAVQK